MKKIFVFLSLALAISIVPYFTDNTGVASSAVASVPNNASFVDAITAQDAGGTEVITIKLYSCKAANGKKAYFIMYKNTRYRIYEWNNYSNPYYIKVGNTTYYFASKTLDLSLSSGSGMLI